MKTKILAALILVATVPAPASAYGEGINGWRAYSHCVGTSHGRAYARIAYLWFACLAD